MPANLKRLSDMSVMNCPAIITKIEKMIKIHTYHTANWLVK
jgi:hypothetical protein